MRISIGTLVDVIDGINSATYSYAFRNSVSFSRVFGHNKEINCLDMLASLPEQAMRNPGHNLRSQVDSAVGAQLCSQEGTKCCVLSGGLSGCDFKLMCI